MQRDEFQNEVNQAMQEICMELRNIPNIGINYMEYMSALIYVMYENNREIQETIKTWHIRYTVNYIDEKLANIRRKEQSNILFKNIVFSKIMDNFNYIRIEDVIFNLNDLISRLNHLKESKKMLAEAFEYIIMKSAQCNDRTSNDEVFYTPKGLVKIMTRLLKMKDNMGIYNPACGMGNFLVESAKIANIYAFGEEKSIKNYNICMTNLWIHDVNYKLITQKGLDEMPQVRYAISNPPFKDERIQNNATHNMDSYIKFLIKMFNVIDEKGRMTIILPQGFLFKKTLTEYELRKSLIEKKYIDSIIELPEKLFYKTKTPVIILTLDKAKKTDDILFIDASKEYERKRKTNVLTQEYQEKILDIYNRREAIEGHSYVASLEEIINNNYDLSVKRYILVKDEIKRINREETKREIRILERKREDIQYEIRKIMKEINEEDFD